MIHPSSGSHCVDADALRRAMSQFVTGVTVVTSIDEAGRPVGTTANAVTSLSLEPPLLLVCLSRRSETLRAVRRHGAFVVNVLGAEHRELSAEFARRGTRPETWKRIDHGYGRTGAPSFHGALACLECIVDRCLDGGDHEIVIGEVCEAVSFGGVGRRPLVFYAGQYHSVAGEGR